MDSRFQLSRRALFWGAVAAVTGSGIRSGIAADISATPRHIGIIGAGQVGGTLGRLWAHAGYQVMFSSRHPDQLQLILAEAGPNAQAGNVAQAIAFADVIVLAVPYKAEPEIAAQYGSALSGKTLIDADNAYAFRDGALANEAHAAGVARYSAHLFPHTHFVRAFNSVNASRLTDGGGGNTEIVYSATDSAAGAIAVELIKATDSVPVRGHDL
ncbi:NAD(P)-binding domain-containing protein [Acetobacter suratthaniensis]|uniref:NAD(P)-binding domain-containing protein n=1 Tax=Acetobacter suratthaniensis TaxID=1502841 RepID=A0ABS3LLY4_9PROT|nr:NAD(P)-binding domain-containing protein [Acetobacter suratthaniensis]MBO1328380.1 NAD(P)-binding domain-containing protein [Acetobacter suratthaniensis]MCX2566503.1 NAD(P)-binding domain-containing protein [Acetobacter suratthaniensis]